MVVGSHSKPWGLCPVGHGKSGILNYLVCGNRVDSGALANGEINPMKYPRKWRVGMDIMSIDKGWSRVTGK